MRSGLAATRSGSPDLGNTKGREIVYERSREEVMADALRWLPRAEAVTGALGVLFGHVSKVRVMARQRHELRTAALRAEYALKQLSKRQKLAWVAALGCDSCLATSGRGPAPHE